MASLPDLEPRPISVADYHRMIDAGILDEDEQVELLEGVISAMSPQKRSHSLVVQRLNELLVLKLAGRYRVLTQLPLTLGDRSEPEPDLAVVSLEDAASAVEHPRRALLVIEASGDSLRRDRVVKGPIYARAGIPEYWIVNLEERCIEVHREPDRDQGRYLTIVRSPAADGGELRSAAVPDLLLRVADLFS